MTIELILTTAGIVLLAAIMNVTIETIFRCARRRREAREQAAALEAADRFMARVFGVVRGEQVAPADIKYGDKILWWSDDGEQHEHYTAGFDGDPGPSTDGKHVRPVHQGEQK